VIVIAETQRLLHVLSVCTFSSVLSLGASLVEKSPFIPSGWEPQAAPAQPAASKALPENSFVLQGVYVIGDRWTCNILDNRTGKSSWVSIGESVKDLATQRYDADNDRLIARLDGKEIELHLKKMPEAAGVAVA
jgi:type II secretory pathway component PulC